MSNWRRLLVALALSVAVVLAGIAIYVVLAPSSAEAIPPNHSGGHLVYSMGRHRLVGELGHVPPRR